MRVSEVIKFGSISCFVIKSDSKSKMHSVDVLVLSGARFWLFELMFFLIPFDLYMFIAAMFNVVNDSSIKYVRILKLVAF
jgi:hypothetical protein